MQNTTEHSQNTQHPYAKILRAIADGKQIQYQAKNNNWYSISSEAVLNTIATEDAFVCFRIKPETTLINSIEVPRPCSNKLAPETIYYIPYLEAKQVDCRWTSLSWANDSYDLRMLELGLVHLTKEAAIKHAEALLSFTQTKE